MKKKLFILLAILSLVLFYYKNNNLNSNNIYIKNIDKHTISIIEIYDNTEDKRQPFKNLLKELSKIDTSNINKIKYTKVTTNNTITFPDIAKEICKKSFKEKDINSIVFFRYNKLANIFAKQLKKKCYISIDYYPGYKNKRLYYDNELLEISNIGISKCLNNIPIISYIVFTCK